MWWFSMQTLEVYTSVTHLNGVLVTAQVLDVAQVPSGLQHC